MIKINKCSCVDSNVVMRTIPKSNLFTGFYIHCRSCGKSIYGQAIATQDPRSKSINALTTIQKSSIIKWNYRNPHKKS